MKILKDIFKILVSFRRFSPLDVSGSAASRDRRIQLACTRRNNLNLILFSQLFFFFSFLPLCFYETCLIGTIFRNSSHHSIFSTFTPKKKEKNSIQQVHIEKVFYFSNFILFSQLIFFLFPFSHILLLSNMFIRNTKPLRNTIQNGLGMGPLPMMITFT